MPRAAIAPRPIVKAASHPADVARDLHVGRSGGPISPPTGGWVRWDR